MVTGVPLVWCSPRSRLGVPGKSEGTIFTPVQCQIRYYELERVAGVCKGTRGVGRVVGGAVCVLCVSVCVCVTAWMHMCKCLYVLFTEEVGGCAHMRVCGNDSECVIDVCGVRT